MELKLFDDINSVVVIGEHIKSISENDESVKKLLIRPASFSLLADISDSIIMDSRSLFPHQLGDHNSCNLPFHLQGNEAFDNTIALQTRKQLQDSIAIQSEVKYLWDVARTNVLLDKILDKVHDVNNLSRTQYMRLMLLVYKALREDFELNAATDSIIHDWNADSRCGEMLSFSQFFAAIFELVDLWTCDLFENTYINFLELLGRRITVRVVVFIDDQKLNLAVSNNFDKDEAIIARAIPLRTIPYFCSTAKMLGKVNVNTVGQLAEADAVLIETERQSYVQKMNFSQEKVGKDLQKLLAMFRSISAQFPQIKAAKLLQLPGPRHSEEVEVTSDNVDDNPLSLIESRDIPTAQGELVSIHKLCNVDTAIIDSFKAAYIIEKDISFDRAVLNNEITEELKKFGIHSALMTQEEAAREYNALYDLIVARDGQDIKDLAQTVLEQIRAELALHGIMVDDVDLENAYDDFYASVIAGSGKKMKQDAQEWISSTIEQRQIINYIKSEHNILRELIDVRCISEPDGILDIDQSQILIEEQLFDSVDAPVNCQAKDNLVHNDLSITTSMTSTTAVVQESFGSQYASGIELNCVDTVSSSVFDESDKDLTTPLAVSPQVLESYLMNDTHDEGVQIVSAHSSPMDSDFMPTVECHSVSEPQNEVLKTTIAEEEYVDVKQEAVEDTIVEVVDVDAKMTVMLKRPKAYPQIMRNEIRSVQEPAQVPGMTAARLFEYNRKVTLQSGEISLQEIEAAVETICQPDTSRPAILENIDIISPKVPNIVLGGFDGATNVAALYRYISLLDLGEVRDVGNEDMLMLFLASTEGKLSDLVCFDVSKNLDRARDIVVRIQSAIGSKLIILGGDPNDSATTQDAVDFCTQRGVFYFAIVPINFVLLRAELFKFFESSVRPYLITRQAREDYIALATRKKTDLSMSRGKKNDSARKHDRSQKDTSNHLPRLKYTSDSVPTVSDREIVLAEPTPSKPRGAISSRRSPRLSSRSLH